MRRCPSLIAAAVLLLVLGVCSDAAEPVGQTPAATADTASGPVAAPVGLRIPALELDACGIMPLGLDEDGVIEVPPVEVPHTDSTTSVFWMDRVETCPEAEFPTRVFYGDTDAADLRLSPAFRAGCSPSPWPTTSVVGWWCSCRTSR